MSSRGTALLRIALGVTVAVAAVVLVVAERRRPLRKQRQREPQRMLRNAALGAMSLAVVSVVQRPIVDPLAERVERRRLGLAQQLRAPAWVRDAVAFALLDYSMYAWHVATHRVPFLWRFHLVHHVDMDMDTSTALRFHAVDMAMSVPWRAAQVVVCGASPRALALWQAFFFLSILFHHSNLRLPPMLELRLVRLLTTPRLHGIHHSTRRELTDSNWSSGLSLWDWLHGTIRLGVPQFELVMGMPGYRDERDMSIGRSLALPFVRQHDAWQADPRPSAPVVAQRSVTQGLSTGSGD